MAKRPLTPTVERRTRFVAAYLVCLNAATAAIEAGYSPRTASRIGAELLARKDIREQLELARTREAEKESLTAGRVLEELRRISFSDARVLFDNHGNIRPITELTREQAACIQSIEAVKKNLQSGDNATDTVLKVRLWDKTKALEMLSKHFGLLTERVEVTLGSELLERLDRGRRRIIDVPGQVKQIE